MPDNHNKRSLNSSAFWGRFGSQIVCQHLIPFYPKPHCQNTYLGMLSNESSLFFSLCASSRNENVFSYHGRTSLCNEKYYHHRMIHHNQPGKKNKIISITTKAAFHGVWRGAYISLVSSLCVFFTYHRERRRIFHLRNASANTRVDSVNVVLRCLLSCRIDWKSDPRTTSCLCFWLGVVHTESSPGDF